MWVFRKPNKRMFLDWRGYLSGIALVALVTLLIYFLQSSMLSNQATILFILVIMFIAVYFNLGSAIFVSILSAILYDHFSVHRLFTFDLIHVQDIPMLAIFLLIGVVISFLGFNLRESENRFRSMVETAGEGIVLIDNNAVIIYVNQRFLDMLGYSNREMRGQSIFNYIDKEYVNDFKQRLENRKKGIGEGYEMAYRSKDGSLLWVRINGNPIFDSRGKVIGSVGMHTDITGEKNLRDQIENYARSLTQIQEEERKRIARELHDDTAPTLSYLSLEVDSIIMKTPDLPEESIRHLKELREKINRAQEDIRRFSHELHPSILDNLGLDATLEALIDELNSKGNLEIQFNVHGTARKLSDDIKLALYRITQEALNNVRKHARAAKTAVNLVYTADKVTLTIIDNGIGFDPSTRNKFGLGLTGMKERADLIGAKLKVESTKDKGTQISVEV